MPLILTLGVLGLSACSDTSAGGADQPSTTSEGFSGPYRADLQEAYNKATNESAREILKDGKITEAEAQSMIEAFRSCLDTAGITLDSYDAGGASFTGDDQGTTPTDQLLDTATECSKKTGEDTVLSLYFLMEQDPGKKFTPQAVVDCYIRAGIVPDTYTVEEYTTTWLERYHPGQELHSPSGAETLQKMETCDKDPVASYVK